MKQNYLKISFNANHRAAGHGRSAEGDQLKFGNLIDCSICEKWMTSGSGKEIDGN